MRPNRIQVRQNAAARSDGSSREFNAIQIHIADMWFSTYLHDGAGGDRQIKLAKKLADFHGITFEYDDVNGERVRSVLGIKEE